MALIEDTDLFMPDFEKINSISADNHVIPVAVQNIDTKEVILIAYINRQALEESIRTRKLVLWSTSRNELWFKGKSSGNTFTLHRILVNCEQNSLVFMVSPDKGGICHTSCNGIPNNCFYRELDMDSGQLINLNERKKSI